MHLAHKCKCGMSFASKSLLDKHMQAKIETFNRSLDSAVQEMTDGNIKSIKISPIVLDKIQVEVAKTSGEGCTRFYVKDDNTGEIKSL